jgi:hypothetical protein
MKHSNYFNRAVKKLCRELIEFADFSIEEGVQLAARTGHLIQFC